MKRGVVCERVDPKNNQAKVKINAIARQQNATGKKTTAALSLAQRGGTTYPSCRPVVSRVNSS